MCTVCIVTKVCTNLLKPRTFKFYVLAFRHTVLRQCNGNFDLLHFFQPIILQSYILTGLLSCDWLKKALEKSVEGQNFHHKAAYDGALESWKKVKWYRL